MSDLSEIRDGIKTVLEAANSKLRVYTYPPDNPRVEMPALVLEADDVQYGELGLSNESIRQILSATFYIYGTDGPAVWDELDKYRSPTGTESIRAGIEGANTLSGNADVALVVSSQDVQRNRNDRGLWEFSCEFTFEIAKSIP